MADTTSYPKSNAGRKTLMTPSTLDKLRAAFMMGFNDLEACAYAQIDDATLYKYQRQHPEYIKIKDGYKRNPYLKAKATIYKNLENPKIAKWWLERKLKDEFSTKQEIAVSNDSDKPLFYLPDNNRDKTDPQ